MAKDKSELSKEERRALKKEKKEKKLVEESGVKKSKSEKSEKKDKKRKREALAEKVLNEIQSHDAPVDPPATILPSKIDNGDVSSASEPEQDRMDVEVTKAKGKDHPDKSGASEKKLVNGLVTRPTGALVPFANPLVTEEKAVKKIFKSVKKAAAQRTLKRGVKEVVKAVRRSPTTAPASSTSTDPVGVVVLAADISPMDVISHIPVLCEDHNIPYVYVTSRAELGMAGQTKRPTSVVMVSRDVGKKAKEPESKDDGEEWTDTYRSLVKIMEREGRNVKR